MDEKPTYQELEKRIQELAQALQKGEEKFRILLDESSDPIFSFYPDGTYRYVNQAFAEGVSKSVDEIVGHSIWDIFPGEEGDKRFSVVKHVFATGKPKTIEVRVPRPEGDQYYITSVKAVKDNHGKVISVICSSKNITDRKKTEVMLRENEERFKYFTEASFEAIFFSEKGVCIEQNPAAEIMFGYTSKEAIGRLGTDWIAPESKDLVMNNMMKGVTEPYEAIAQKKDGSTFPARIHAKEMQYKGRTIRVTSLRDITDFKMLENGLRNREKRFRLIAQSTNDVFYEWIVKTGELRWFGDIDTALGYQKGEIEHTLDAWLRVIHPEDRPSLDDAVKLHINSTETINYVYRVIRKDGSLRYWHDHSLPILESDNKPEKWVGGISDITEQKQAEQEKAELVAKLNRAQKMESLGLLAGGVAHDLNNVLSGIVSYPELILLDLPEDSKFRKPIETMQTSGHRATAIVQDLLTVARGAATTKEPLNLNDLISDYLNSPEFKKLERFHPTVTVNVSLDTDLLNIDGSPVHISKVVMNLVSNASEAIEGSGNVTISTMNRYIDRPLRGYDDVNIGEYAVLSVSDVGSGVASHELRSSHFMFSGTHTSIPHFFI